jgi:hypothetical protein
MSKEEISKLEEVKTRIEELVHVFEQIRTDIQETLEPLGRYIASFKTEPKPAQQQPGRSQAVDDVRMQFPENLGDLLFFEDKDDCVIVKPKQFLGSENFAKVAAVVRGIGGEYVSAGRASYFRISKRK